MFIRFVLPIEQNCKRYIRFKQVFKPQQISNEKGWDNPTSSINAFMYMQKIRERALDKQSNITTLILAIPAGVINLFEYLISRTSFPMRLVLFVYSPTV
jgi:hypothetical protein